MYTYEFGLQKLINDYRWTMSEFLYKEKIRELQVIWQFTLCMILNEYAQEKNNINIPIQILRLQTESKQNKVWHDKTRFKLCTIAHEKMYPKFCYIVFNNDESDRVFNAY